MTEIKRLPEVLRTSADALEGLYKELERNPPPEAIHLIKELRDLSNSILSNQDFLNSTFKLTGL
jgi:hypothetical protein